MTQHELIGAALFFVSVVFSYLVNGLMLKFSHSLGIREQGEVQIRWASTSKPALGGIAFYIVFLFSLALFSVISDQLNLLENKQMLGLILSSSLGFIIGLADDAYNTRPLLKFLGQVTCGLILVASGTTINISPNETLNHLLTLFWVVGIMNSVNMLDNMDAVTATVSISIMAGAIMVLYQTHGQDLILYFILLGCMGALLGFLFYNWHPSKMYMGDTGSQFLGIFLAAVGIICFWNTPFDRIVQMQSKQLVFSVILFLIPIVDTTTVTINRLMKGKSPFVGGRDHTTHHLSYLGLSDRQVVLVFAGINIIGLFVAYNIIESYSWDWGTFALYALFPFGVFGVLYYISRTSKPKKNS